MSQPQIHFLGDSALLCSLPPPATLKHQQRIWGIAELAADWPEVSEVVPGMNNLTLLLRRPVQDLDSVAKRILEIWPDIDATVVAGRDLVIPVVYGGSAGPDLDTVARHTGLSVQEVIAQHTAAQYTVYFIGFMPGFAYLGGLDPCLATPHQSQLRASVAVGSVGISGEQTGIYPRTSPSDWQLLGRTSLTLFDPDQNPPTLLRPGDRVRFTVEGMGI